MRLQYEITTLATPPVEAGDTPPTKPASRPARVCGRCRLTSVSGTPIVVEVRGSVDWSTGMIELVGVVPHLADTPGHLLGPSTLTPRELQVARLLALGDSNAQIASALRISPHTARRHTESVMLKLGAKSRAQVGAILRGDEE
jgi:DNA-binding CsgD family transcriptional regulator